MMSLENIKIAIGSDHGGFLLKEQVKEYLLTKYHVEDMGCESLDSVDYPIYAHKVAHKVASKECDYGLLICTTGVGMSMAANKTEGVRAVLATKLDINYISRTSNKNAKAGNYNHALQQINSPYIATFDADMAPTPDFIYKTLPFFFEENNKIGFVQLPQSFNNPDIFQYRFKAYNKIPFEQDYFYHSIQIAKNATNSAIYCGTNTLFSREALNSCNGFATKTISEDIATGMLIESNGYKCLALDDIEAYGSSVTDLTGFIKQRSRWARGCIQILKNYKILKNKGLSFRQKLEYLSCISYWFFGLRRMIYLLTPLLFSIFGIIIIDCNLTTFIALWLPAYILKRFTLDILENKKRSSTWNKIYETILTPILFKETLKEFFGFSNTKFEVSPKYSSSSKMSKTNFKLLISHLLLLSFNIIGLIMCIFKIKKLGTLIPNFFYYLH